MSTLPLEIESVPGNRNKLVLTMTEHVIDVSGRALTWSDIDRVKYSAVLNRMNGSYMGTTFSIDVGNATRQRLHFSLHSGTTGPLKSRIDHETRDRQHAEWLRIVEVLEARVCERLAGDAIAIVAAGGTVDLGGVRIDPAGVHKRGLLGRSIAWGSIVGTETDQRVPLLRVLGDGRGKSNGVIQVPSDQWNVVLLPRVIAALAFDRRIEGP